MMPRVKKYETILRAIGHVAHNRPFTVRDLADSLSTRGISPSAARYAVRKLYTDGLLHKVEDGYFPKPALWDMIESACGMEPNTGIPVVALQDSPLHDGHEAATERALVSLLDQLEPPKAD